jgi:fructokinase
LKQDKKKKIMSFQSSKYPVVCYGEILWDVLPGGALPGGAPMNASYHLKKLGINPALITKVGLDVQGKKLIELMEKNRISTDYFQIDYVLATGMVNATVGENHEVTYDIVKPVAWDNIGWEDSFESLVSGAGYFVFGSLSTRTHKSRQTLYRLREMAICKVVDINLRAPHFTRKIIEELLAKADLLKLNEEELEFLTGWFNPYNNETDRIHVIQDRFKIPNIVVTKGSKGAVFYTEGKFYSQPGFHVRVQDTIGSGDAFLAALIVKLIQGRKPPEALEFASALGALVASYKGPCPEYDPTEINTLIESAKNQHQ